MLNKFHKKAFTMTELVMSLVIMAVVAISAINVVFKKSSSPKKPKADIQPYFICNANSPSYNGVIKGCNFELTTERESREFIRIKLIGGGGGASQTVNGENGEEKTAVYPSLVQPFKGSFNVCNSPVCVECASSESSCTKCSKGYKLVDGTCEINFYYRLLPGDGGKGGTNPKDGGQSSVLVMAKKNPEDIPSPSDEILAVLETASGGSAGALSGTYSNNTTELSQNDTGSSENFGMGGSSSGDGRPGEVRIEW